MQNSQSSMSVTLMTSVVLLDAGQEWLVSICLTLARVLVVLKKGTLTAFGIQDSFNCAFTSSTYSTAQPYSKIHGQVTEYHKDSPDAFEKGVDDVNKYIRRNISN